VVIFRRITPQTAEAYEVAEKPVLPPFRSSSGLQRLLKTRGDAFSE
jgi:hypothetical protein